MLPESKINADDFPRGPWGMARLLEARIAELEGHKRGCQDKAARREINRHLHLMRDMLAWCKTRAGYVEPEDT